MLANAPQEAAEKADMSSDVRPGQSYAKMLHAWHTPVGPHLAAQLEGEFYPPHVENQNVSLFETSCMCACSMDS